MFADGLSARDASRGPVPTACRARAGPLTVPVPECFDFMPGSVGTTAGIALAALPWWEQGCGCHEGIHHDSPTDRPGGRDDHRRQSADSGSQCVPDRDHWRVSLIPARGQGIGGRAAPGQRPSLMIPAGRVGLRRLAARVMVAMAVWVSALPFVLLLVVPRVGIGPAILIVIGLLGGISLICCFALCIPARARRGGLPASESVAGGTGKEESKRS